MADIDLFSKFQYDYHIPKKETQAASFLSGNPTFDGRGVKIAIWDSGIDPLAEGFQITSHGDKKIIGLYDTTGSGDIDTSYMLNFENESRLVKTLSNREITVPDTWLVDDNSLHLGVKSLYELLPSTVSNRLTEDFRSNRFNVEVRRLQAELQRSLDAKEKMSKNKSASVPNVSESTSPKPTSLTAPSTPLNDKLIQEDNKAKEEFLQQCVDNKFPYSGPLLDVFVFQSNGIWKCVVDTSPYGGPQLAEQKILGNFSESFDCDDFHLKDKMTYSVNIQEDGNLLEIVTTCSAHGSHVGSIAAGFFPHNPEKNGVAPGAQLVSIKIGDTRLDGMETAISLCRAAQKTIELGCDIVNLSYGEPCMVADVGEVSAAINEMILKHGIIFCSSSGNNGPALSTVGSPGSTTFEGFGISPVVFPDMGRFEYNIPLDRLPGPMPYTWASRGPSFDGGLGILITAPGGAIASTPQWTLSKNTLMNGSSMSSPNGTGCISLVLSALKQYHPSLKLSPHLLRLALEQSSQLVPDHTNDADNILSQGAGLIQVEKAYDYIVKKCLPSLAHEMALPDREQSQVVILQHYGIRMWTQSRNAGFSYTTTKNRGIYLREFTETQGIVSRSVTVGLAYFKDQLSETDRALIDIPLVLECDAPWVTHPQSVELTGQEISFNTHIDCTALKANHLHFTYLKVFHRNYLALGPIAQLPITVIVPMRWPSRDGLPQLTMKGVCKFSETHRLCRQFISFPSSVTAINVSIFLNEEGDSDDHQKQLSKRMYRSHLQQLVPGDTYAKYSKQQFIHMPLPNERGCGTQRPIYDFVYPLAFGERTVEWCIARWWQECSYCLHREHELTWCISVLGLTCSPSEVTLLTGVDNFARLNIHVSAPHTLQLTPSVNVQHAVQVLQVQSSKITCLSPSRDNFSGERQLYGLENTYDVCMSSAAEVSFVCPLLNKLLYDCPVPCQMWIVSDSNKRRVLTGDYKSLKSYKKRLSSGNYTLRLHIQHFNKNALEKFQKQTMLMYTLLTNVTLQASEFLIRDSQPALADAVLGVGSIPGSGAISNRTLKPGDCMQMCFSPMLTSKTLNQFAAATYLEGQIYLLVDEKFKKTVFIPFKLFLPRTNKAASSSPSKGDDGKPINSFAKKFKQLLDEVKKEKNKQESNSASQGDSSTKSKEELPSLKEDSLRLVISSCLEMITLLNAPEQKEVLGHLQELYGDRDFRYLRAGLQCATTFEEICQFAEAILEDPDCEIICAKGLQKNADLLNSTDSGSQYLKDTLTLSDRRDLITKARLALGIAIGKKLKELSNATDPAEGQSQECEKWTQRLQTLFCDICRWNDRQSFGNASSAKNSIGVKLGEFFIEHALAMKYYGVAMKTVLAVKELRPSKELDDFIVQILDDLNWKKLADWFRNEYLHKYATYPASALV